MSETTPVKIPPVTRRNVIDAEAVRFFMFDRTAADNPLVMDLEFSDEEIGWAMKFAALRYNEMEPQVEIVDYGALPFGMIFLTGTAAYLYLQKFQQLTRNNMEYTAGNMTVDINAKKIEAVKALYTLFKEEFEEKAASRKRTINIQSTYRTF